MSGINFPISLNSSCNTVTPLVCATNDGHITVWALVMPDGRLKIQTRAFKDRRGGPVYDIAIVDGDASLFSLYRYSQSLYALIIDTAFGYSVCLLNGSAHITGIIEQTSAEIPVLCRESEGTILVFLYNDIKNTLRVGTCTDWENLDDEQIYHDVWTLPRVFMRAVDDYIVTWLTMENHLQIAFNNVFDHSYRSETVLYQYIDELIGTEIDDEWVVLGGWSSSDEVLCMNFVRVRRDTYDIEVIDRYMYSEEYKKQILSMASVGKGFMILAEDTVDGVVRGQRFTHLGGPLYNLIQMERCGGHSWAPALGYGENGALLVYLKETGEDQEVWGKWLVTGEIQEISNLRIQELL